VLRAANEGALETWLFLLVSGAAVEARAAKYNVVRADLVLEPAPDPLERPFEWGVGERLNPPAVVADEMVMVLAARESRLVARHSSEIDALNEAALQEDVEYSVDGGESNRAARVAKSVEDLLGAQTAALLAEELDHRCPRFPASMARTAEHRTGVLGPSGIARHISRCSHGRIIL
jgi:hypothetical protein